MTNAVEAYNHAEAAHQKVEAHEDLCAERYAHISTKLEGVTSTVGTIQKQLAWGGSIFVTILLGLLAFFGAMAISQGDSEVKELKAQIEKLQHESDKTN